MNTVVLGLDGTEASRSAVRWCAANLEPGCTVVAVCGIRNFGELVMSIPPFDGAVIERKIADRLRRDWCLPLFQAGLHCRTHLVHRAQADAVLEEASSIHADAVVVGVELHHGIGAAFRRAGLDKVIQRAPCPVMLVPTNRPATTLAPLNSSVVA
ncbi:MAG: universal stress protein [Acidimicrobiales bacterium]